MVRLANAEGLALVPSGGRTGLSGGAVAERGEVVVSFDRKNRILGFDPRRAAGALPSGRGDRRAAKPLPRSGGCSIRWISRRQVPARLAATSLPTRAAIRVIRYGLTRGLDRRADGGGPAPATVLRCKNGLVKNATGYDFRHLFIGSEGTLGLGGGGGRAPGQPAWAAAGDGAGLPGVRCAFPGLKRLSTGCEALSAFEFFSDLALTKVRSARDLPPPLRDACPFYALLEFDESALDAASSAFERCLEQGLGGRRDLEPERRPGRPALGAARGDFPRASHRRPPTRTIFPCALATCPGSWKPPMPLSARPTRSSRCAGTATSATATCT